MALTILSVSSMKMATASGTDLLSALGLPKDCNALIFEKEGGEVKTRFEVYCATAEELLFRC